MQITSAQKGFVKILKQTFRRNHQLYVQNGTLLLPEVSENFQNMYIGIYGLDLANFICASGLA